MVMSKQKAQRVIFLIKMESVAIVQGNIRREYGGNAPTDKIFYRQWLLHLNKREVDLMH